MTIFAGRLFTSHLSGFTALALLLVSAAASLHAQPITIVDDTTTANFANPTWNVGGDLSIGITGSGARTLEAGGTVNNTFSYLGDQAGSTGTVTITGGTWANSIFLAVGNTGTENLLVNGGTVTNTTGYLGRERGSVGSATVSSGTWNNSSAIIVGYFGNGALTISGGLVTADQVAVAFATRTVGSLVLSGSGVLQTRRLYKYDSGTSNPGTGTMLFDGGTLRATEARADFFSGFLPGEVTIDSGGAFIDSNNFNVGSGVARAHSRRSALAL